MKLIRKMAVFCFMVALLCAAASAAGGFNAGLDVDRSTEGMILVTVQDSTVLAEKQPTLSIPCDYTYARVTFEGERIDSVLADGAIAFRVARGGVYTITELAEPDYLAHGICGGEGDGSNLTWALQYSGIMTISGEGTMADFSEGGAPWYEQRTMLKEVVIENGVKMIGAAAFYNCLSLESVTIPVSVGSVGAQAFARCQTLKCVLYLGNCAQWEMVQIEAGNDLLTATITFEQSLVGDVDGDHMVTSRDVVTLLRAIAGKRVQEWTEDQRAAADASSDGKINIRDAILILKSITETVTYTRRIPGNV